MGRTQYRQIESLYLHFVIGRELYYDRYAEFVAAVYLQ